MTTVIEPGPRRRIIYPDSDGKPMGETETHRQEISDAIEVLKDYFRAQQDVYVNGNMFIYYEKGQPEKNICPDVFVVRGVDKRRRRSYYLWKEGHSPCVALEMTSRSTRRQDEKDKLPTYARLGVNEYFLFDPFGEYLQPPLRGYRLTGGVYLPITPLEDGALPSLELGLLLQHEAASLRFVDAATGERLLKPYEVADARRSEAAARRDAEQQARKAEQQARKAEQQARAEAEARQAEAKARREAEAEAEAEAKARREAEAEVARLRAELARLQGEG